MIIMGKAVAHIDSLVKYVFKEEKEADILKSDGLDLSSPTAIIGDFEMIQNSRLKNQYLSLVISPAENKTNDTQLEILLDATIEKLDLKENQYLAVIHDNTEHRHLHVIVNRTGYDGKTFNDSFIGFELQTFSRELAHQFNLESAYDKRQSKQGNRSYKKNDFHQGKSKAIEFIREALNERLYHPNTTTVDHLFDHLREKGVDINIMKHKNGTYGVVMEYDGQKLKASEVSRKLSLKPDGDSYAANNKLQPILTKNMERDVKERTIEDIKKDLHEDPANQSMYLAELAQLTEALRSDVESRNKNQNAQDRESRKKKGKNKQLGMKVKY